MANDFIPLDTSTSEIPRPPQIENQVHTSKDGLQNHPQDQHQLFLRSAVNLTETLISQALVKANPQNKIAKITVYKSGNSAIIDCVDQETYSFLLNKQNLLKPYIANDVTVNIYTPSREKRALAKPVQLPSVVAKDVQMDITPEQIRRALNGNHNIYPVTIARMVDKATKLKTKSVRIICNDPGEVDWLLREGFSMPPLRIRCEQDKNMLRNKVNNLTTQVRNDVGNIQAMRTSQIADMEDGEIIDFGSEEFIPKSPSNDINPRPPQPIPNFYSRTNFQHASFQGPPIFHNNNNNNDSTNNMVWSTREQNNGCREREEDYRGGGDTRRDHGYHGSRHHDESRYQGRRHGDEDQELEDFDDQRIVLNDGFMDYNRRHGDRNSNNQYYNNNNGCFDPEYRGNGHGEGHGEGHGRGHGEGHEEGHGRGRGEGHGRGRGEGHGRGHGEGHGEGHGRGGGRRQHQRCDRSPEDYRGFLQAQSNRRSACERRSYDRDSNWDETDEFRTGGQRRRDMDQERYHWSGSSSQRERSPHHRYERNYTSNDRERENGHHKGWKSRPHLFNHDDVDFRRQSSRYHGRLEHDRSEGRRVTYLATDRKDDEGWDFEPWEY